MECEFARVAKAAGCSNGPGRFPMRWEAQHAMGRFQPAVAEKLVWGCAQMFPKTDLQMAKRNAKCGGDIVQAQWFTGTIAYELARLLHQSCAGIALGNAR
jgi:hypothetical protein